MEEASMDTFHLQVVLNSLLQEILLGVTLLYFAPCLYISFRGVAGGETPQVTIYKISVAQSGYHDTAGYIKDRQKVPPDYFYLFLAVHLHICSYCLLAKTGNKSS